MVYHYHVPHSTVPPIPMTIRAWSAAPSATSHLMENIGLDVPPNTKCSVPLTGEHGGIPVFQPDSSLSY